MPRSEDAKQWKPDAFGQYMIDQITNYAVVAERCSEHLRSLDLPDPDVQRLWAQVQTDFLANPDKYPSVMADQNDMEGRQQFQSKCQAICFPPHSELPRSPEDHIRMIFAAQAGLQSFQSQDHPYGGEIHYRANLQVIKQLRGQAAYDAAVQAYEDKSNKPLNKLFDLALTFETIKCRDKMTGKIEKYTITDHGNSVVKGDYFVLQDDLGCERQVTARELLEICVFD